MPQCGEACGLMAAGCAALAFGSFAVPIKSDAAQSVDIDPLVFQSYKTFVCFVTSWLILLAGEGFTYTPWGIVSGLFWVPGGVATVYAVKAAGLAIGVGIGSSFIVLVSFVWGIFVFGEPIHSRASACFAILCMMLGLFGMSCYSSPQKAPITIIDTSSRQGVGAYQSLGSSDDGDRTDVECTGTVTETDNDSPEKSLELADHPLWVTAETTHSSIDIATSREESTFSVDVADPPTASISPPPHAAFKVHITKSELGMMSAAFCGIWGGSIMAPMKFCKANTKGTHYLLSFSIGASIVTVALWFLRYTYHAVRCRSVVKAFECLPSFHLRVMWRPGGLSGLLWSIGNFFSMISVFYLGEAVGYPLVQTSILFAGLWGIFYFKEVQGIVQITKWLLSSLLTIFGILLLSYEHHQK